MLDAISDPRLRPPRCGHCGGCARPGAVWFSEPIPSDAWKATEKRAGESDLMVVVGTSGIVQPAASLSPLAKRKGARMIEINPDESAISSVADAVWLTSAATAFPLILDALERAN